MDLFYSKRDKQMLSVHLHVFSTVGVDCEWSEWVTGDCSTTCGIGYRRNSRTKLVEEANGGTCTGESTEIEECNLQCCPGNNKPRQKMEWN